MYKLNNYEYKRNKRRDDENDCYALKDRQGNIKAIKREDFERDYEPVDD